MPAPRAEFDFSRLPDKLSDLPKVDGQPQGCAWGLFDQDGKKDELGCLNFLTQAHVLKSIKEECHTGERVQLDWRINGWTKPGFGRSPTEHKILDQRPTTGFFANDDQLTFNTQISSQWDGFRHIAHQPTGHYYNGLHHEAIHDGSEPLRNGIQNWVQHGGIAGRAVLIDWLAWAEGQNKQVGTADQGHKIPVSDLEAVLKHQGTQLQKGDILIVRTGFLKWYDDALKKDADREEHTKKGSPSLGLDPSEEMVNWLWSKHFAAIAADNPALESWPPSSPTFLHDWLLTQWGCPIGELWDLEKLSEICKREKKYSFFLTSAPLHVPGGVATPCNAIALF